MTTDTTTLAASCDNVARLYRSDTGSVLALQGIDARFPLGSITAIVGPSGAGKSTLLRLLAGVDRPDAGTIEVDGTDLATLSGRKRRAFLRRNVGYVFQRPSQNVMPNYTVREHLDLVARLHQQDRSGMTETAADQLGLRDLMSTRVAALSPSRRQQLAIGMALVGQATLIIADEPTADLDAHGSELVVRTITDALATGASFVVASHDPVVLEAADQTIAINAGTVSERRLRRGPSRLVIDRRGRLQLPASVLERFPDSEATLATDDATHRTYIDP
jgi:putative ABC transport system ATP-binding protein